MTTVRLVEQPVRLNASGTLLLDGAYVESRREALAVKAVGL